MTLYSAFPLEQQALQRNAKNAQILRSTAESGQKPATGIRATFPTSQQDSGS
jgi:hypothetical protein